MQTTRKLRCTDPEVEALWIQSAEALPPLIRRRFLTAVWSGQTIAAARDIYGLSLEQAMGVMAQSLKDKEQTDAHRADAAGNCVSA